MKTIAVRFNFSGLLLAGLILAVPGVGNAKPDGILTPRKPIAILQRPARTPSAFSGLSSSVRTILNPNAPVPNRLEEVRRMGDGLNAREITSLCSFLAALPDVRERNRAGLRALKSDVLAAIEQQATPPQGLTGAMAKMYENTGQDPVIRDYALQHMVVWCQLRAGAEPGAKEQTRKILEMAADQNNSSAGTALLGLHRLCGIDASKESEGIDDRALGMASSPEMDGNARVTAVQVCAERGVTRALPAIERLTEGSESKPLRLSAINALGRLGGVKQTALLRRLVMEHDLSLLPAVTAALRQLELTVATQTSIER